MSLSKMFAGSRILKHFSLFSICFLLQLFSLTASEAVRFDFAPPFLLSSSKEIKLNDAGAASILTAGEGLNVKARRLNSRPGERWIDLELEFPFFDTAGSLYRLEAAVYPIGKRLPVSERVIIPERAQGRVSVDMHSLGLTEARLCLNLLEGKQSVAVYECLLSVQSPALVLTKNKKIKILIDKPAGATVPDSWPVTFGIPFPAGALWDVNRLSLLDGAGRSLPCQIEPAALWAPKGAVKWARFDALVNPGDDCYAAFDAVPDYVGPVLKLEEQGDQIMIDTGVAIYLLGKGQSPIIEIRQDDKIKADTHNSRGLYVVDQNDRLGIASLEGEVMTVESSGPVASCVRFEGYYKTATGENLARHITRIENFAGQASAKITHTLVLSESTLEIWLKEVGWEFSLAPGSNPEALFGISHTEPLQTKTVALDGINSVYMLQDSHYYFAHGSNHFAVKSLDSAGQEQVLFEGEECGEFAALKGAAGGLLVGCRDAALQHPKEFELTPYKMVLRLFSNRGGDELDFRSTSLIKAWDLENWYKATLYQRWQDNIPGYLENVQNIESDALGWSKTHELFLQPLTPEIEDSELASSALLHNRQVYALADPEWSCLTDVFGPLHPKDAKNFPLIENSIDSAFSFFEQKMADFGYYSFAYYYLGPHLRYRGKYVEPYRYASLENYTVIMDTWHAYARSGERRMREFCEKNSYASVDAMMSHWSGSGKVKGLFMRSSAPDNDKSAPGNLPFHWHGYQNMQFRNIENTLYQYYLTGSRRALDYVNEYADGIKEYWTYEKTRSDWQMIALVRSLALSYAVTWDFALLELMEATADILSDSECALGLTKDRPYRSTSYKTHSRLLGLQRAWEVTGYPRYHEWLALINRFWWLDKLGVWPVHYVNNQGSMGSFLYSETGNPAYPEILALQVRHAQSRYTEESGLVTPDFSVEKTTFIFQGMPYAQKLMALTGADKKSVASWVAYEDFGYPVSIIAQKSDYGVLKIDLRTEGKEAELQDFGSVGGIAVRPVGIGTTSGLDLNRVLQQSKGIAEIEIPKDAPEGAYEILTPSGGFTIAVADSLVPLVVFAPEYWCPAPPQRPCIKWFFNLPPDSEGAQIFLEYDAQLFDPEGQPWPNEEPQNGWIDLPVDKPGLWSFAPMPGASSVGLVRVKNLPPFFAAREPSNYFEPPLVWEKQPKSQSSILPEDEDTYVPGVTGTSFDQALYLGGRQSFVLPNQLVNGNSLLPFKAGTIEFFFKPAWSTFDLPQNINKRILTVKVQEGKSWYLNYLKKTKALDWFASHVLFSEFMTDGPLKRLPVNNWRQTVLENDEWVHIAWVWGASEASSFVSQKAEQSITAAIYVNGKKGKQRSYAANMRTGNFVADQPLELTFGQGVLAAYDELRLSCNQRYQKGFVPPTGALSLDEHTLALFHFNGNCEGVAYGVSEPITGELR